MWALLMIYRETITVAEKHLLETGLGPPIHFTQATEASKMFSCLVSNFTQSYLVPLNQCFSLACFGFKKAAYKFCENL